MINQVSDLTAVVKAIEPVLTRLSPLQKNTEGIECLCTELVKAKKSVQLLNDFLNHLLTKEEIFEKEPTILKPASLREKPQIAAEENR